MRESAFLTGLMDADATVQGPHFEVRGWSVDPMTSPVPSSLIFVRFHSIYSEGYETNKIPISN